jgi:hypothetical protein
MDDMDSRIRRAIEQSAAAEAASLLARLRSTKAGDQLAVGHGRELVQAVTACVPHDHDAKNWQIPADAPAVAREPTSAKEAVKAKPAAKRA